MTNSQKNATPAKCFSAILCRLLCTESLPTHPSDLLPDFNPTKFTHPNKTFKTESLVQAPASPGIVARLMGLDSLPPHIKHVPKKSSLDFTRSRSVNFLDYLPLFDLTEEAQHRTVRTSVSFREIPTFSQTQNQDFLVLCIEKGDETNEVGLKVRKPDVGSSRRQFGGRKTKKLEVGKKSCKIRDEAKTVSLEALPRKKDVCRKPSVNLKLKRPEKAMYAKEVCVGLKDAKKSQNGYAAKKVEAEFNSTNSSPISEDSGLMGLNSRKKSSRKMDKCHYPPSNFINREGFKFDEVRAIKTKADKWVKTTDNYYIKMLVEIRRLTEDDIKGSNLINREVFKFEDFEDICLEFGQRILELLLNQVLDELCGNC